MQKRSLNLLINKYRNYPHWHEIDDFLVKISKFRPKVIILFGSLVKGEYTQNSDIDLLIVSSEPVLWEKIYALTAGHIQPIVRPEEEINHEIACGNPFFIQVFKEGIFLTGDRNIYASFQKRVDRAIKKLGIVISEHKVIFKEHGTK